MPISIAAVFVVAPGILCRNFANPLIDRYMPRPANPAVRGPPAVIFSAARPRGGVQYIQ